MNLGYIKNLDALRAIAALGVIVAHAYSIEVFPQLPILATVAYFGNFGVSLFFVLSGFVITRILMKTHEGKFYFRTFYIRRLLRIFPLYYVGLLAYYFLPFLLGMTSSITPFGDQLVYYGYLQNVARTFEWHSSGPGHYWSLAVEEHFYLLWPAVVYVALKYKPETLLRLSVLIVIAVHLLRIWMLDAGYNINVFTLTRLDQLVYGGIIAIAEYRGSLLLRNMRWFIAIMIIGLLLIVLLESTNPGIKEVFKYTFFGFAFTGLICSVIVLPDTHFISKLLQHSWLRYLGKISYGLYVWHVLAMTLVTYYFHVSAVVQFVLVTFSTVLLASVSYAGLEEPFLRLKSKFDY